MHIFMGVGGGGWVGLVRNKANLSLARASQLGLSLAIKLMFSIGIFSLHRYQDENE